MKANFAEHLVCPKCKISLRSTSYREDPDLPWQEIVEGCLTCESCYQEYPISKGVPRFLPATQLKDEVKNTVEGFGYEWTTFNDQIQDSFMTGKTNFLDFIYPVTEEFFEGKMALDAGCGMGRFLRLAAKFGCQDVIGIDLSDSVDAAYRNTRTLPNAHVVQADILSLPFANEFDYIFSIGVLQFLSDPYAGFHQLSNLLKRNGSISIWVYAEEGTGWLVRILNPLRMLITSRLPRPVLYHFSRVLGVILFAILRLVYRPANEGVFGIRFGSILPLNEYLYYTSRLNYASMVSVIFDHLVPQTVVYLSKEEIEGWFVDEKLQGIHISSRNNMSWRGLGTRAVSGS